MISKCDGQASPGLPDSVQVYLRCKRWQEAEVGVSYAWEKVVAEDDGPITIWNRRFPAFSISLYQFYPWSSGPLSV